MAALPNRCFSFAPLQSLSARRNGAKEVIHDAGFFFSFFLFIPPIQIQTALRMRSERGLGPLLVGFLLLMTPEVMDGSNRSFDKLELRVYI